MLSMPLGFEGPALSGKLSRRQLLHMGGLSMLGLGLPSALRANEPPIPARAREPGTQASASEKSCIFIVMGGGPSHVDIWDMKPLAPVEIRGPYKPIATSVPGVHINELMPRPGQAEPALQPHSFDDAHRADPQPPGRDAQLPDRAGESPGRRALLWFGDGQAAAIQARPDSVCLAASLRSQYDGFLLTFHLAGWVPGTALRSFLRR